VLREKYAKRLLLTEEDQLQQQLTQIRNGAVKSIEGEEKELARSIGKLEKEFEKFEAEIAKDAVALEKGLESGLGIKEGKK
jgi:hypothetical protein